MTQSQTKKYILQSLNTQYIRFLMSANYFFILILCVLQNCVENQYLVDFKSCFNCNNRVCYSEIFKTYIKNDVFEIFMDRFLPMYVLFRIE